MVVAGRPRAPKRSKFTVLRLAISGTYAGAPDIATVEATRFFMAGAKEGSEMDLEVPTNAF